MSHTPGPWKVNKYGGIGSGERGIDKILVDSSGICDGEAADYELMAAAPDLLEACKEQQIRLTDLFNRHERKTYSSGADSDLDLLLATGLAAIAKAEGRP